MIPSMSILARLATYADRPGECWEWPGALMWNGYEQTSVKINGRKRATGAHRVAYAAAVGPIPRGMDIDHLCRNRRCINPLHMEVVTRRENVRRGVGRTAVNARKTACNSGHPFTPENTYIAPGVNGPQRICKECRRVRDRRRWAKRAPAYNEKRRRHRAQ